MTQLTAADIETREYRDVERLIWSFVYRFASQFGGDIEEYYSHSHEIYMRVQERYNPNVARFSTYLLPALYRKFKAVWEFNRRRDSVWQTQLGDFSHIGSPVRDYYREYTDNLSDDAALIVDLIMETPHSVPLGICGAVPEPSPTEWRRAIHKFLRSEGWPVDRIKQGFEEIKAKS